MQNTLLRNTRNHKNRDAQKLSIWEVLEEYADVRDLLGEMLEMLNGMQDELESALFDLSDELDEIDERLCRCDRTFKRYKVRPEPNGSACWSDVPDADEREEPVLPFPEVL